MDSPVFGDDLDFDREFAFEEYLSALEEEEDVALSPLQDFVSALPHIKVRDVGTRFKDCGQLFTL